MATMSGNARGNDESNYPSDGGSEHNPVQLDELQGIVNVNAVDHYQSDTSHLQMSQSGYLSRDEQFSMQEAYQYDSSEYGRMSSGELVTQPIHTYVQSVESSDVYAGTSDQNPNVMPPAGDSRESERRNQLEHEISRLSCLLATKEKEWNTILRLKRLKELLLVHLKQDAEGTGGFKTKDELLSLAMSSLQEILETKSSDQGHEKAEFNAIQQEMSSLEAQIARKLQQPQSEQNSPKLAAALNGSPAVGEGTKRKQVTHESPLTKKVKTTGSLLDAPSFNYADVLNALAKISAHETSQQSSYQNPVIQQQSPPTAPTNQNQSKPIKIKPKAKTPAKARSVVVSDNQYDTSITLANLLSGNGSYAGNSSGIVPVVIDFPRTETSRNRLSKLPSQGQTPTSSTRTLSTPSRKNHAVNHGTTHQNQSPELIGRVCQGCNRKPALFVCAGCERQWYCDRECQTFAWTNHSEHCSREGNE